MGRLPCDVAGVVPGRARGVGSARVGGSLSARARRGAAVPCPGVREASRIGAGRLGRADRRRGGSDQHEKRAGGCRHPHGPTVLTVPTPTPGSANPDYVRPHYRRDVTLGEDACRTANRPGAEALASLRNLTNGIYELALAQGRTQVDTLSSWCQQQTFTKAWRLLQR